MMKPPPSDESQAAARPTSSGFPNLRTGRVASIRSSCSFGEVSNIGHQPQGKSVRRDPYFPFSTATCRINDSAAALEAP